MVDTCVYNFTCSLGNFLSMLTLLDLNVLFLFFVVYGVIGIKMLQAHASMVASVVYLSIGFVLMGVLTTIDSNVNAYMLEWWFSLRGVIFIGIGGLLALFIHRMLRGV